MQSLMSGIIPLLATLVCLALVAALGALALWSAGLAKTNGAFRFLETSASLAKAAVQVVESGLKEELKSMSEDGKIDPSEWRQLREHAVELLLAWGGPKLKAEAFRYLGVTGETLAGWATGLVERAVATMPQKSLAAPVREALGSAPKVLPAHP